MLAALRIAAMAAYDMRDAPGGIDCLWIVWRYDGRVLSLQLRGR